MCLAFNASTKGKDTKVPYESYLEACAALEALMVASELPHTALELTYDTYQPGIKNTNIEKILAFFKTTLAQARGRLEQRDSDESLVRAREKYAARFGAAFSYEFSDDDVERIQQLINELRDLIVASEHFEDKHRNRILKRLEALQRELNKKMSNVDRFWGLVGDAGVAANKFGTDAKPLVDRIREIAEIAWRVQARAEGLPVAPPLPLLTSEEETED